MRRGFEMGGKYAHDPIGSEHARGKDAFRRKSGRDLGFTPSELHQKAELMRQFMKNPEGPGGNSMAYQESPVWCRECNGRRMVAPALDTCERCSWKGVF